MIHGAQNEITFGAAWKAGAAQNAAATSRGTQVFAGQDRRTGLEMQIQREAQAIETRAQIGSRGWNTDFKGDSIRERHIVVKRTPPGENIAPGGKLQILPFVLQASDDRLFCRGHANRSIAKRARNWPRCLAAACVAGF